MRMVMIQISILIMMMLLLAGCGRPMTDDCSDTTLNILCRTIFNEKGNSLNRERLDDLEKRTAIIEFNLNNLDEFIHNVQLESMILQDSIDNLYTYIDSLIDANDIEIINLCGNNREILIKTDTDLIAVFKHGNKVYLSKLQQGNYVTTDGMSCHFTVGVNNNVSY